MQIPLETLRAIVGAPHVLTGDDVSSRREDWMTGAPCQAGAIVRPADTEQLSAVMRACYEARQPIVTHGGLTGLVHGAEASPDELVISLERMTAIEEIDRVGGTLTVQAGAPLQRVQEAAREVGLQFPLDLGARGSCTIGGNIATNAGGVRVIRYGMMRQQVLGLEAVMADGRVVSSMNRMLKNNAGFDLKQLFIGSEGTLGIVTRAVLRLQPPTPFEQTAMVACPSFDALTGLLSQMGKALGGSLGAFEVMWQNHYRLLTETLPNAKIERFASNDEAVAAFASGRVDAVSQFHPALIVQVSRIGTGSVVLPRPIHAVPTSVGLPNAADSSFKDWVNEFITKTYESGKTTEIFEAYISTKGIDPAAVPGLVKEDWD